MPNLTSIASTLRSGGFSFTGFLATIPRTVVLEGTVSAVPSYPALQISYTLDDGSTSDVTQDMTVEFFSSTGVFKSSLRIASGQSVTSVVLPVNEFSAGVYDVAAGDTFKVYDEYRIKDRLVSATAALNKDSRIALTDQLSNQAPVCNSGGPYAGENTSVSFAGDTSFTIDPDSAGTVTHAWDFIDATPPTSTNANPSSIVFPVGFRHVKHTATDASNSKSTVQYVPTWVFDKSTYQPLQVQVDNLNEQIETGRLTFKLPFGNEGSLANLPDGSPVVYFEKEMRHDVEGSYGSNVANRSHIKFSGYLVRDSISIDADNSEVTFEAVGVMDILAQTPALPQLMVSATSPAKWSEIRGLSTKDMLWYLSYFGATLQTAWDFVWSDAPDLIYERVAVEGATIAEQLRDIANGLNVQATCDPLGRIQFIRDPHYLTEVQRAARTKVYDFTTADIIKIDITREHQGSAKSIRGEGITPTNAPVFSNAPGDAPASFGIGSETLAKQIVNSQDDLNTRTGYHFARVNSLYAGRFVPKGVRLTVPDGYDIIQPSNREFVTIALPAGTNTRGVSFASTERWTVEAKDITYDPELGTKEITYTLDHETIGVAGVTYIPPQEGQNGLDEFPPLDFDFPDLGFDPGTGLGVDPGTPAPTPETPAAKNMAVGCSDNKLYLTADFDTPEGSGGPTYAPLDLTGLAGWGGGDLIQFEVDAYSPAYLGTGDEVNGYLLTDEMCQRIEDIFGTPTLGTANVFADASTSATMQASRGVEGFVVVARWVVGDGVYAVFTDDSGTTWNEDLLSADENTDAGGIAPGVFVDPHTDGKAYVSVWTATGDNDTAEASIYRTTNYGTTWALLASPTIDSGVDVSALIAVPFNNTAATRIIHRRKDGTGLHLIRNYAGTEVDITPEIATFPFVPVGEFLHELASPFDAPNTLVGVVVAGLISTVDSWAVIYGGTELSRGIETVGVYTGKPYIEVEAEYDALEFGGYGFIIESGGAGNCSIVQGYAIVSGSLTGFALWVLCGESLPAYGDPFPHFGVGGTGVDLRAFGLNSSVTFAARVYFDVPIAEPIYSLVITKNVQVATPTWDTIATGDDVTMPYREVYALGAGRYLVTGVDGAIGVADDTDVDSRMGNISTSGRICGTAAK